MNIDRDLILAKINNIQMGDAFFSLYKNSFISEELSKNLIKMVGFRNIAVHEYQRLDLDILKSVVKNNLKDFEEFYKIILEKTKSK